MHADFELNPDGSISTPTHGGARDGAGRKPKGYQKAPEVIEFEKARARNEAAKAQLNELEVKIKSGEYVSRAAVQQASATIIATFAQGVRSIADNLERKGIAPEICAQVETILDEGLASLSQDLEMMSGD